MNKRPTVAMAPVQPCPDSAILFFVLFSKDNVFDRLYY